MRSYEISVDPKKKKHLCSAASIIALIHSFLSRDWRGALGGKTLFQHGACHKTLRRTAAQASQFSQNLIQATTFDHLSKEEKQIYVNKLRFGHLRSIYSTRRSTAIPKCSDVPELHFGDVYIFCGESLSCCQDKSTQKYSYI